MELLCDALGSEQAADRGRVRLIAYDVEEGMQPFASSNFAKDQNLIEGLKKTLPTLKKETENATLTSEELAKAVKKAKGDLDSLLNNRK